MHVTRRGPSVGRRARRTAGLSLIELLVALSIGLVLIAGVIQIFTAARSAMEFTRSSSDIQEKGRFALNFLEESAQISGHSFCSIANIGNPGNHLVNFLNQNYYSLNAGVYGWEANNTGIGDTIALAGTPDVTGPGANAWSDDAGNGLDGDLTGWVARDSDVVVFKGARTALAASPGGGESQTISNENDVSQSVSAGDTIALQPDPGPDNRLQDGSVVVASDCQSREIFRNTHDPASNNSLAIGATGNSISDFADDYDAGEMHIGTLETAVYFVGEGVTDPDDDGNLEPALIRWQPNGDLDPNTGEVNEFQILMEGVETMQVLYGVDTDTDPGVDQYVEASNVGNWADVRSVQIGLLIRSGPVSADADVETYTIVGNDGANTVNADPADIQRRRRVFSRTIALENQVIDGLGFGD